MILYYSSLFYFLRHKLQLAHLSIQHHLVIFQESETPALIKAFGVDITFCDFDSEALVFRIMVHNPVIGFCAVPFSPAFRCKVHFFHEHAHSADFRCIIAGHITISNNFLIFQHHQAADIWHRRVCGRIKCTLQHRCVYIVFNCRTMIKVITIGIMTALSSAFISLILNILFLQFLL